MRAYREIRKGSNLPARARRRCGRDSATAADVNVMKTVRIVEPYPDGTTERAGCAA
jgi:hypothetical protein